MRILLGILLVCSACAACKHPEMSAQQRQSLALSRTTSQRAEEISKRIEQHGADKEVWAFARETLEHPSLEVSMYAGPTLFEIVKKDPAQRERALQLIENAAPGMSSDAKTFALLSYETVLTVGKAPMFLSPSESGFVAELVPRAGDRMEGIEKRGHLSADDRQYVSQALSSRDALGLTQALTILLLGANACEPDREWAVRTASERMRQSTGDERRFWTLVQKCLVKPLVGIAGT